MGEEVRGMSHYFYQSDSQLILSQGMLAKFQASQEELNELLRNMDQI